MGNTRESIDENNVEGSHDEVKRYEQAGEEGRSLALTPSCVLAGCESGRIVALPIPSGETRRTNAELDCVATPSESLDSARDRGQRMESLDDAVAQVKRAEKMRREAELAKPDNNHA